VGTDRVADRPCAFCVILNDGRAGRFGVAFAGEGPASAIRRVWAGSLPKDRVRLDR